LSLSYGEAISEVCRAFGISRKTGYKIFERYKEHCLEALTDRSRRFQDRLIELYVQQDEARTEHDPDRAMTCKSRLIRPQRSVRRSAADAP